MKAIEFTLPPPLVMVTVNLEVAPVVIEVGLNTWLAEVIAPHVADEKTINAIATICRQALILDTPWPDKKATCLENKQHIGLILFNAAMNTSCHHII